MSNQECSCTCQPFFLSIYLSQNGDLEPYLTLRGHTGPLYCTEHGLPNSNLIYTGGNEGLIQIWAIPKPDEVSQYGESDNLFNMNVGFFQKKSMGDPDEIIWDLKHHPKENLLILRFLLDLLQE